MPLLSNLKHERFANHVAEGKTQAQAYKLAGFRGKTPEAVAYAIAGRPEVKARIKELASRIEKATTKRVSESVAITKEWVLRTLVENIEDARKVKGGSAVANRGLELLGKELGLFRDPVDKPPVRLEDLPDEVLQKYLADADAAIAANKLTAESKDVLVEPPAAVQ